jgi:CRISPR-associated endonuclease/helicase Cas3
VFVLWRDFSANGGRPADDEPQPHRDELCPAPIGDVRKRAGEEGNRRLWLRDRVDGTWRHATPNDVVPGAVLFADAKAGGYDPELGWAPDSRAEVPLVPMPQGHKRQQDNDDLNSDGLSFDSGWIGLARHLSDVEEGVGQLATEVRPTGLSASQLSAAVLAGRYHDLGKAHPVFQATLRESAENAPDGVLAKSPKEKGARHSRPYFRHELVSALMLLHPESRLLDEAVARGELAEEERDLVVYLVAAHHGKVRLGARSVKDEALGEPPRLLGVQDGDETLPVELSPDERIDVLELDTSLFHVGAFDGDSWTARALRLRDRPDLGPFRLAYLEALVRIADMRVSRGYRAKEAR